MGTLKRGMKNAFRNLTRTVAVVLILAVTFALALVMLVSHQAATQKVQAVSDNLGTTITVVPANSFGFGGGGNPLTTANVATISSTPHVVSVVPSVQDRLQSPGSSSGGGFGFGHGFGTGGTTSLYSPITGGFFSQRFGGGTGTLPVEVTGTSAPSSATALGASSVRLTSGAWISGSSTAQVADVGSSLATKNALRVGSTFTAYNKTITVDGIFTTDASRANAQFVLPLKTAQTLSGIDGVNTVTVTVDNVANVASTTTALQQRLGTSVAQVTSAQSGSSATAVANSLSSIKTITVFSLVGALIAAAAILLMSMLMIVRERRREIGILKAFGSSNGGVVTTFVTEALTITAMAAVVGTILGVALSNPVLSVLVKSTNTTSSRPAFGNGPPGGGGFRSFGGFGFGGNALGHLHAAIGTSTALYAVGIAVVIALLGSAVPAYATAKVRPAEVMRSE